MSLFDREDFEDRDWFKFLTPDMQREFLEDLNNLSDNEGIHVREDCDHSECLDESSHSCDDNIDCCDAYRIANEGECSSLKSRISDERSDAIGDAMSDFKEHLIQQIKDYET